MGEEFLSDVTVPGFANVTLPMLRMTSRHSVSRGGRHLAFQRIPPIRSHIFHFALMVIILEQQPTLLKSIHGRAAMENLAEMN
jgi:hypothetical protein